MEKVLSFEKSILKCHSEMKCFGLNVKHKLRHGNLIFFQ